MELQADGGNLISKHFLTLRREEESFDFCSRAVVTWTVARPVAGYYGFEWIANFYKKKISL